MDILACFGLFPPQDALDPKNEANTSVAEPLVEVILCLGSDFEHVQ